LYRWWVFVHVVGVFGFLISHGVSMYVTFELRNTRDPRRIVGLLELSASSIRAFYWSVGVLGLGGVVSAFLGHWWRHAWQWAALAILVIVSGAMYRMARPFYRRVGLVARALAGGSSAVSDEELQSIVRGRRPLAVAGIGFVGLLVILYLMMMQPSLGFRDGLLIQPGGPSVVADIAVSANNLKFDKATLTAPAGRAFTIEFVNKEAIPHNIAIYIDRSKKDRLFKGADVLKATVVYRVRALTAGSYFFECTIHPDQMFGTLNAR
jgi:plastocyanin